jgi:uncharacterized protein (DUF362 family)
VIEGVGQALKGATLTVGAQSLPGFPTRYSLGKAGFAAVARAISADLVAFDEAPFRPAPATVRVAGAGAASAPPLPGAWLDAGFKVALPRLTGSTFMPFAGSLRHLFGLLPQQVQLSDQRPLPQILAELVAAASPDLIVLDAIQALHQGGELSGTRVDLGVLIIGRNPVAVDLVCAELYGVPPDEMTGLASAAGGPSDATAIRIVGDLGLDDLKERSGRVRRLDPNPERYPLPAQVKVIRASKARLTGAAGALTETFSILERAGIRLDKARETAIVIGAVDQIPKGTSEYATIVFLDDTSRGDHAGYSRVVRLAGRNAPVSRVLMNVPYAMTIANIRTDLGLGFAMAGIAAKVSRILRGSGGQGREAAGRDAGKGGGDSAAH